MAQNDSSWLQEDSSPVKSASLHIFDVFNGVNMAETDKSKIRRQAPGVGCQAVDFNLI